MNHLSAFVPLGPAFMGCARRRNQKKENDLGFAAALNVPDWEDNVCTSLEVPGTDLNMSAEKAPKDIYVMLLSSYFKVRY